MLEENRIKGWNDGWDIQKDRAEVYGEFLKDNDFETWQPICYMEHDSVEFREGQINAQREYLRGLWILNRCTIYASAPWYQLCDRICENWRILERMIESNRKWKDGY